MENINLFETFTQRLNDGKFSYFITGSIAAIYYGMPRLTHDVDIILDISRGRIATFIQLFATEEFYVPPLETIIEESARTVRGHFNLIHLKSGFKADIYLIGTDPLQHWALKNKKEVKTGKQTFYIAPAEYVIIRKLEYYQEGESGKHLEDIRNMLDISGDLINFKFIDGEVTRRGLTKLWSKLKE
jgi:hypothetical protein